MRLNGDMMIEWLQVGRKVVCIVDVFGANCPTWQALVRNRPVKNGIYTIREIADGYDAGTGEPILAIKLIEIHNSPVSTLQGSLEPDFDYHGFRPLVTRKTDISIFEKMLRPDCVDA